MTFSYDWTDNNAITIMPSLNYRFLRNSIRKSMLRFSELKIYAVSVKTNVSVQTLAYNFLHALNKMMGIYVYLADQNNYFFRFSQLPNPWDISSVFPTPNPFEEINFSETIPEAFWRLFRELRSSASIVVKKEVWYLISSCIWR